MSWNISNQHLHRADTAGYRYIANALWLVATLTGHCSNIIRQTPFYRFWMLWEQHTFDICSVLFRSDERTGTGQLPQNCCNDWIQKNTSNNNTIWMKLRSKYIDLRFISAVVSRMNRNDSEKCYATHQRWTRQKIADQTTSQPFCHGFSNRTFRLGMTARPLHQHRGSDTTRIKNGGQNLQAYSGFADGPYGYLIMASTSKGVAIWLFRLCSKRIATKPAQRYLYLNVGFDTAKCLVHFPKMIGIIYPEYNCIYKE